MVIEDDLTKLEFTVAPKKALLVLKLATNNFSGPMKLWKVKRVPSVTTKMELDIPDLPKAAGHGVEYAYFNNVRISVGVIVGGFESHALEAQMLIELDNNPRLICSYLTPLVVGVCSRAKQVLWPFLLGISSERNRMLRSDLCFVVQIVSLQHARTSCRC